MPPVLMEQPQHLVRVSYAVGGKLERDHAIDRPSIRLPEVDEPRHQDVHRNHDREEADERADGLVLGHAAGASSGW